MNYRSEHFINTGVVLVMIKKIHLLVRTSVKELSIYKNLPSCTSMADKEQTGCTDKSKQLSKRAQRKIKNKESEKKRKLHKRQENAAESLKNDSDVVLNDHLNETTHYYQHGLRKVYPYYFTFSTYAKGRWMKRTILDVFMAEFKYKDEEEIKDCIEKGKITVNGEKVSTTYLLKNNDYIQNIVHRHELPVTKEDISIVANTDQLLVVNKPSSIPVHPCGRYRHNSLTYILAKQHGFKNLRTIYRIDRLTSGVMIFCKTEGRAHQMINHIKDRLVQKEYMCRVEGEFPSGVIQCKEPIAVMSRKIGLFKIGPGGKESHTTFERLSYNGTSSVVQCQPHTGRTHQIRVHLQYLGYPILNDPLYRGPVWGPEKGKGGVYGRTEEELIEDIFEFHNTDQYVQDSDTGLSRGMNEDKDGVKMNIKMCNKDSSNDTKVSVNEECNKSISDSPQETKTTSHSEFVLQSKNESGSNPSLKRSLVSKQREDNGIEQASKLIKLDSDEQSHENVKDVTDCSNADNDFSKHHDSTIKETSDHTRHNLCDMDSKMKSTSNSENDHGSDNKCSTIGTNESDMDCKITSESTNISDTDNKGEISSTIVSDIGNLIESTSKNESDMDNEVTTDSNVDNKTSCVEYNESLMTYDADCVECQQTYRDPSPKDLVMYLHAYSYKGPDWEYSTDLPSWAAEDWVEQE